MASGLENIETIESPFRRFVTTIGVFPTAFTDAMTYYECLAYLVKYLEETVIPAVNENAEAVEELQRLYIQLKSYVDNYFDNLDVQKEINNKLDAMVEAGTLQEIIGEYLNATAVWGFDTVADMKASANLINGSFAKTLGYHAKNDGGGALYKIRTITNDDVVDEALIIELSDNTLIAEMIVGTFITPEQFGCYGDNTHDDTVNLQKACDSGYEIHSTGNYKVNSTIDIKDSFIMESESFIHLTATVTTVGVSIANTVEQQINKTYKINVDAHGYSTTTIAVGNPKKCICFFYVENAGTTGIDLNYYDALGNNENEFTCHVNGNSSGTTNVGVKVNCSDSIMPNIVTRDCVNGVFLSHGELIGGSIHSWINPTMLSLLWANSCVIKTDGEYRCEIDWLYQDTVKYGINSTGMYGHIRYFEDNQRKVDATTYTGHLNINNPSGALILTITDFRAAEIGDDAGSKLLTYNIPVYKNNVFGVTGINGIAPIYQSLKYHATYTDANYAPQIESKYVKYDVTNLPATINGELKSEVIGGIVKQTFYPLNVTTGTTIRYWERYRAFNTDTWSAWYEFTPSTNS